MSARLLYDLTGLVHWYAYFRHPGGVQRVIEKVATSDVVRQSSAVEFVVRILGSDRFYRIEPELITNLSSGRSSAISRLRRILAQGLRLATLPEIMSEGRHFHLPYLAAGLTRMEGLIEAWTEGAAGRSLPALDIVAPPGAQDTLFNPGDLWWQKKYVATVAGLKARTGVRIVQMIHDLYLIERRRRARFCRAASRDRPERGLLADQLAIRQATGATLSRRSVSPGTADRCLAHGLGQLRSLARRRP